MLNPEIISAVVILTIAAYIDWKEHRVPNWLTFSAWGCGLAYHGLTGGWSGFQGSLAGSGAGLATLIIPYALRGMGAGDVKLMAATGAWVGTGATLQAFLWIALAGGVMGLYAILRSREMKQRFETVWRAGLNLFQMQDLETGAPVEKPARILLPYGVPIAFGFYAYFLFGGLI